MTATTIEPIPPFNNDLHLSSISFCVVKSKLNPQSLQYATFLWWIFFSIDEEPMPIHLAFRAPKFVLENPVVYLSDEEPCVTYLNFMLLLPHIGHTLCVGFSFAALERAKKQHTARPIEKKKANSTAKMPTHMHNPTIKIIPIIVNISCIPPPIFNIPCCILAGHGRYLQPHLRCANRLFLLSCRSSV